MNQVYYFFFSQKSKKSYSRFFFRCKKKKYPAIKLPKKSKLNIYVSRLTLFEHLVIRVYAWQRYDQQNEFCTTRVHPTTQLTQNAKNPLAFCSALGRGVRHPFFAKYFAFTHSLGAFYFRHFADSARRYILWRAFFLLCLSVLHLWRPFTTD